MMAFLLFWLLSRSRLVFREYKRMFLENPNPMFIIDVETTRFLSVNDAAIKQYGYSREEFERLSLLDIRPQEEIERLRLYLQQLKDNAWTAGQVWKHKRKDGRIFHVRVWSHITQFNGRKARLSQAIDVEAQVKAEEQNHHLTHELAQKNLYLESLLNTGNHFSVARTDLSGRFTYRNETFRRQFGYTEAMADPLTVFDAVHSGDHSKLSEAVQSCLRTPGTSCQVTLRSARSDGGAAFVSEWEFVAIENADGKLTEIQGIGHDVTERARFVRQITDANERFDSMMASIQEVIWSARMDRSLEYVSPSSGAMLGYTPQEFYRDTNIYFDCVLREDRPLIDSAVREAIREGRSEYEFRWRHPDGRIRHIRDQIAVAKDAYDVPVRVNGISTDVTRLREAEHLAQEYDRRLTEIMESITDSFFVVDHEMNFIFLNRQFIKALKLPLHRRDLLGHSLWEFFSKEQYGYLDDLFGQALAEQKSVRFEMQNPDLDAWFLVTVFALHEGMAVYFSDITDKKRFEQTILEQNRKFREIAWVQSHKVRAPLARLMGLVQIINTDNFADPNNELLLRYLINEASELDKINAEVVQRSHDLNLPQNPAPNTATAGLA